MKCEFDYCIYNNAYTCILDGIEINALGMCEECELINISYELLEEYKQKRLKQINET